MPQGPQQTANDLILATDLDGTFAGGSPRDRERLQAALTSHPEARLIYVTGRSVPAARDLMTSAPLPPPHLLIADVGTTVVEGSSYRPLAEIHAQIEAVWPGREAVRSRLEGLEGIEEQDVDAPRRLSFWLRDPDMGAVLSRMAERLEHLEVDLVGSAGTYIDVLPGGVNKGSTLLRTIRWLGVSPATVVVAGDTLNDLALFETGLRGVVVANCEPALRERLDGREHLYFAEREGAAGVHEGLLHFGCLRVESHGE